MIRLTTILPALTACLAFTGTSVHAQDSALQALLSEADSASPRIASARNAAEAAWARVPQAGAPPDPTVGFGLMNVPIADPGFGSEMMTMTQLHVSTRLPWPGKLGLREEVAELRAEAADREVERVREQLRADVKTAYYELYFVDRALEVTARNRELVGDLAGLTEVQYAVGTGRQPDVLKAQVEGTRLTDQIVALRERRAGVVARLNGLLGRPTDTPVQAADISEEVRVAALAGGGSGPSFVSATLAGPEGPGGAAGAARDPVLDVAELQRLATEHNPMIRAHLRRVAAEERALDLSGKATLPDVSVTVGYSWRQGIADFFNVGVSAPIPLFSSRKQDQGVREQEAVLADHRSQHGVMVDALNAEIASLAAELRRAREQLVLLGDGILPQARTGLASATASYRVGSVDFLTLLDAQVTLFRHELDFHRLLADFATNLAALERAVGTEVLR